MSEHTLTDARQADDGPETTTPARPADEVKLVELRQLRLERVVLVGVAVDGSVERAERSVEELQRLAETAGAEVLDTMIQRRASSARARPRSWPPPSRRSVPTR